MIAFSPTRGGTQCSGPTTSPLPRATRVTVAETGFDKLFAHRQQKVYGQNEGGWRTQMAALERYLQ